VVCLPAARPWARAKSRIVPFGIPRRSSAVLDRPPERATSRSRRNDTHSKACRQSESAEENEEARLSPYRRTGRAETKTLRESENLTADRPRQRWYRASSSAAAGWSRRGDDKKADGEARNGRSVQSAGKDCQQFSRFPTGRKQ